MDGDARPRRRHHLSGDGEDVTSADTTGSSGMMTGLDWMMNGVDQNDQEEEV